MAVVPAGLPEEGTPEWWLRYLHSRLIERQTHLDVLYRYRDGEQPVPFSSEKYLDAFGGMLSASATNVCGLVIECLTERLLVDGFRVGDAEDEEADSRAWDIWQRNNLDALQAFVHEECLLAGESYVVVWFGEDEEEGPVISVEDAEHCIVVTDRRRRDHRIVALRLWLDEYDVPIAELYLPDAVYLYVAERPIREGRMGTAVVDAERLQWQRPRIMPNPLGVVPVVPFSNAHHRRGVWSYDPTIASELAPVMPIQDHINKLSDDMIVASEYAAMPQRFATGLVLPRDEQGQVQNPFKQPLRLWIAEQKEASFGQFAAADLTNYTKAIEERVTRLATITRIPPHYLNVHADRLSGESLRAAESGLVAKVRAKQRLLGEPWEEVMRLAGMIAGDQALAEAENAEVVWQDPQAMIRVDSQVADAALKRQDMGVPQEQLWEDMGYSPQQIARFKQIQEEEAEAAAAAAPPPVMPELLAPAPGGPPPAGGGPAPAPPA